MLDGRSGAATTVRLRLTTAGVRIARPRARTVLWIWAQVELAGGEFGGGVVRLERRGPLAASVTVADPAFLDAVRHAAPGFVPGWAGAGRRGRRIRLVAGAALGAAAVIFAVARWGVPAVAAGVAARVPPAWEARLGDSVLTAFAPAESRWIDPRVDMGLRRVLGRLTVALGPSPYAFRIVVVDWRMINAFALPGGTLVITRGLLAKAGSPEEVAGVLAHEIQHVVRRHATRSIIERGMMGLIWTVFTGDATATVAYAAQVMTEMSYSRALEREADAGALPLLLAAGIHPAGLIRFFERIKQIEGKTPKLLRYLSSHPLTADRLAGMRAAVPHGGWTAQPLLPAGEWDGIRKLSGTASKKTR